VKLKAKLSSQVEETWNCSNALTPHPLYIPPFSTLLLVAPCAKVKYSRVCLSFFSVVTISLFALLHLNFRCCCCCCCCCLLLLAVTCLLAVVVASAAVVIITDFVVIYLCTHVCNYQANLVTMQVSHRRTQIWHPWHN